MLKTLLPFILLAASLQGSQQAPAANANANASASANAAPASRSSLPGHTSLNAAGSAASTETEADVKTAGLRVSSKSPLIFAGESFKIKNGGIVEGGEIHVGEGVKFSGFSYSVGLQGPKPKAPAPKTLDEALANQDDDAIENSDIKRLITLGYDPTKAHMVKAAKIARWDIILTLAQAGVPLKAIKDEDFCPINIYFRRLNILGDMPIISALAKRQGHEALANRLTQLHNIVLKSLPSVNPD